MHDMKIATARSNRNISHISHILAESLFSHQAVINRCSVSKFQTGGFGHWTDDYMALFQSLKVEVFSHWADEYMALLQSF